MKEVAKIEIKDCPFCGNEPVFDVLKNSIYCISDLCPQPRTGYFGKWSDLMAEWNARAK